MQQTIYVVRGFLGGRRQLEERFTSEERAKRRVARLVAVYDSVVLGRRNVDSVQRGGRKPAGWAPDLQA